MESKSLATSGSLHQPRQRVSRTSVSPSKRARKPLQGSRHASPSKLTQLKERADQTSTSSDCVLEKFRRKYKLLDMIGEGIEGKVYLARDRVTKEKVAAKQV